MKDDNNPQQTPGRLFEVPTPIKSWQVAGDGKFEGEEPKWWIDCQDGNLTGLLGHKWK